MTVLKALLKVLNRILIERVKYTFLIAYRKRPQNEKNVKNAKRSESVKTAQYCRNVAKMPSRCRQKNCG